MRRPLCALLLPAVIALAACSEANPPSAPAKLAADLSFNQACQFSAIVNYSRQYFNAGDFGAAEQIARTMRNFYNAGDLAGATDQGFNLLSLTATATDAGRQAGSAQTGSDLSNAVLACMQVGPVTLPVDFTGALTSGGFTVRGGPNDPTGPVLSRDGTSGVGLAENTWGAILGGRTLFFGSPDPNTSYAELLVGQPFTWSTIPAHPTVRPGLVIGFCVLNPGRFRVAEDHPPAGQKLLYLRNAGFFLTSCTAPAAVQGPGGFAAGPVGGSATGFSGFAPVDPVSINLSFVQQPGTVAAGQPISPPVQVLAAGNGGTPLPQVSMSIGAVDAQNNFIPLKRPMTTDASGLATFADLVLLQPGTYTLQVRATASGFTAVQATSAPFTVTP